MFTHGNFSGLLAFTGNLDMGMILHTIVVHDPGVVVVGGGICSVRICLVSFCITNFSCDVVSRVANSLPVIQVVQKFGDAM